MKIPFKKNAKKFAYDYLHYGLRVAIINTVIDILIYMIGGVEGEIVYNVNKKNKTVHNKRIKPKENA